MIFSHTILYHCMIFHSGLSGEILNQIYNQIKSNQVKYEIKYPTMIVIFNGTINMSIANTFDIILDLV